MQEELGLVGDVRVHDGELNHLGEPLAEVVEVDRTQRVLGLELDMLVIKLFDRASGDGRLQDMRAEAGAKLAHGNSFQKADAPIVRK